MSRAAIGAQAEADAAMFLQRHGAHILTRNYHCRQGEIDLIIQDGSVIAFVEVRRRDRLTAAADSIDDTKRRKICLAAVHYLAQFGDDVFCRFDVVLVDGCKRLQWIKDAFRADD